jgi:type IV secretion system protein VirD4
VPGELLVFVAGHSVIRGRQILYFLDPTFSKRSKIAPPKVSDAVRPTSPAKLRAVS